jgi:hypothetical protein
VHRLGEGYRLDIRFCIAVGVTEFNFDECRFSSALMTSGPLSPALNGRSIAVRAAATGHGTKRK